MVESEQFHRLCGKIVAGYNPAMRGWYFDLEKCRIGIIAERVTRILPHLNYFGVGQFSSAIIQMSYAPPLLLRLFSVYNLP